MSPVREAIRELERDSENDADILRDMKNLDDDDNLDLPDLDDDELGLPNKSIIELMAGECLFHKRNIASIRMNLAANKSVRGNEQEVQRLEKGEIISLNALQRIKRDYGRVPFNIANEVAELQAIVAQNAREEEKKRLLSKIR